MSWSASDSTAGSVFGFCPGELDSIESKLLLMEVATSCILYLCDHTLWVRQLWWHGTCSTRHHTEHYNGYSHWMLLLRIYCYSLFSVMSMPFLQ